jgi:Mg2+-importing ATPase
MHAIRTFMITFGMLSSVFDYLTFGLMLFLLHASTDQFRTGWFIESVVSAALIVLVIRTRLPFFRSRPGTALAATTAIIVLLTMLLPFTPLAIPLGLVPLPIPFFLALGVIFALYVGGAEIAKRFFHPGLLGRVTPDDHLA